MAYKRKLLIPLILVFFNSFAKDIYVSKDGNDANAGTLISPYLTITKAANVAVAGDVVYIRQGTYQEVLKPINSGSVGQPIIFQSYPGEQVILSAMKALSGWTKTTGSIYKTTVPFTVLGQQNFIMNDNTALTLARWPNKTSADPFVLNSIRNTGGSSKDVSTGAFLTESSIPSYNWTGGAVFFYGDKTGSGWTAWKSKITSSSSGKVNFNLIFNEEWVRTYHAPADLGDFYLEGVKEALDYQNEWYYDESTKELFVQLPNGTAPVDGQIKMRSNIEAINLKDKSYIQIKNIAVFGGTINMEDSTTWQATNGNSRTTNNLLYGVTSLYGNHTQGISTSSRTSMASINLQGSNNVIEKCEVAFNAAAGIQVRGNSIKIINNYIHDFDYLSTYDAPLVIRGITNCIIKNNTIFNGGRDAIQYAGTNNEIAYNDISHSNLLADDCALFYTVGKQLGTEIHHNWFHDATGRGNLYKAAGIYLDNDAEGFKVHHNVVWNVEWTNIQINWNGKDIDVFNNTLCKAGKGTMGAWHQAGTAFSNVNVWNNITDKQATSAGGQETETTWEPQSDKQNNIISKESFVNWENNDFHLKENAPAVDYGRIITGYTDGYKGASPDAGAYELGDNWVPGINWDPKLSPNGLGCYGLPGENCLNLPKSDQDKDGVADEYDLCPNTPIGIAVNTTGCPVFTLAADNFTVLATAEQCASSNNGSISITSKVTNFPFTAKIEGTTIQQNFTANTIFENLQAKDYSVCITTTADANYKQCFDVKITEPKDLSVFSKIDDTKQTLKLDLSGGETYKIVLNNVTTITKEEEISLGLNAGKNTLIVTTDKDCQGIYEKDILINDQITVFPNSVKDVFTIEFPFEIKDLVTYRIISSNGQVVRENKQKIANSVLEVNIENLEYGIYFLSVMSEAINYNCKIIKQ
ncbi:right-handed parallel beta-helix repeat-containing protein [Flavobacterium ovatum]|uniref:T9SS type A sorting domain-containing protein n=1 Tax=Flavobacterium ovatum TaxID=1928857 RepID=UPI00344F86B5